MVLNFKLRHLRKRYLPPSKELFIIYLVTYSLNREKTAETIVEKLGANALRVILEDPSALDAVPRLSAEKKKLFIALLSKTWA